uniref:Uncharacterized protein n=1 Tax=Rhizophora mucronata TaxID=61149 RepID=A0A2P2PBW7_RHIMU
MTFSSVHNIGTSVSYKPTALNLAEQNSKLKRKNMYVCILVSVWPEKPQCYPYYLKRYYFSNLRPSSLPFHKTLPSCLCQEEKDACLASRFVHKR